jgi:predicted Fe-Mo cluster-binding NifX family protein
MSTLKEQLERLTNLKHRLAVWEAVHAHLDEQFISKDGRKAQKAIKVPGCSVPVVPEETIEDVLQAVGDGPITELQGQIAEIENQEVVILGEVKAKA